MSTWSTGSSVSLLLPEYHLYIGKLLSHKSSQTHYIQQWVKWGKLKYFLLPLNTDTQRYTHTSIHIHGKQESMYGTLILWLTSETSYEVDILFPFSSNSWRLLLFSPSTSNGQQSAYSGMTHTSVLTDLNLSSNRFCLCRVVVVSCYLLLLNLAVKTCTLGNPRGVICTTPWPQHSSITAIQLSLDI